MATRRAVRAYMDILFNRKGALDVDKLRTILYFHFSVTWDAQHFPDAESDVQYKLSHGAPVGKMRYREPKFDVDGNRGELAASELV